MATRKTSSTKRENLIGYWLDGDTGRLRGIPRDPKAEPTTAPDAAAPSHVPPTPTEATAAPTKAETPRAENENYPAHGWLQAGNAVAIYDKRGWKSLLDERGAKALLVMRDRFGFRWERRIGLHDDVSQIEAARLLGIPLSRLNRWVRTGKLKSRKLDKLSVIRAGDLYRLAVEMKLEVPRGRPFIVPVVTNE